MNENEDDLRLYQFQQEFLCQWPEPDPIYECFIHAWTLYFKAADEVDGHLPVGDKSLAGLAVRAGNNAMTAYLKEVGLFWENYPDMNKAKTEALRRLKA